MIRASMEIVNKAVLLNVPEQHRNEVTVIIGGNGGILVTIDANGHIHVLGPEGPGDPEVRQAVHSVLQGAGLLAARTAGMSARA